jgi:hypothetical protein
MKSLITSLQTLFNRYKIGAREGSKAKAVDPTDLELVGYMFLTDPALKEWKVMVWRNLKFNAQIYLCMKIRKSYYEQRRYNGDG